MCPFRRKELDIIEDNDMAWAEAYLRTKWHIDPSSRLVTTDMDRKVGAAVPAILGRGAGLDLTQCGLVRGLPRCQVAS